MNLYQDLVALYDRFLALFPPPLQWLVTLIVVIALIVGFINLIRHSWLFLILLLLLLPAIFPILQRFFGDLYRFFLYLVGLLGTRR
ncbi:MAG: hypothetical protein ACRDZ4_05915 [Egibacteraceae bacterium]